MVEMYATRACPYCMMARRLLDQKNVQYTEVLVDEQPQRRAEMSQRSGRQTVPQIFIGATHVGGFDDMYALEQRGQLDNLLTSAGA